MRHFKNPKIWLILPMLAIACAMVFSGCAKEEVVENLNGQDSGVQESHEGGDPIFTFAIFGDNGSINNVFKKVVKKINEENYSFAISAGDITDGKNRQDFISAKEYLDNNLGIPYYIAIGDNDLTLNIEGERSSQDFTDIVGPRNQSFDFQGVHFAILDSSLESQGVLDQDLDWLEEDLSQYHDKQVFVITHVPPEVPLAESLLGEISAKKQKRLDRFKSILEDANVDHLYTGHFHGFLEYDFGETPVTITGGAGSDPQLGLDPMYHFIEVKVYEDGCDNDVIEIE